MTETLLHYLNSGAAIIVVLGLCLFFHEAGHFFLAKLCKMHVEEFALGFGRALWQRRYKETTYRLNVLPLGGYVRIAGMEPGAAIVEGGFHSRPRWQGALVIMAGSTANVLLAFFLFTAVTAWQGVANPADEGIYIGKVFPDTPAQKAGLKAGDRIEAVDGQRHSLWIRRVNAEMTRKAGLREKMLILQVGAEGVYTPREFLQALQRAPSPARIVLLNMEARSVKEQIQLVRLPVLAQIRHISLKKAETALRQLYGLEFAPLDQSTLVGYIAQRPAQEVILAISRAGTKMEIRVTPNAVFGRVPIWDANGKQSAPIRQIGRIGVVLRGATRSVSWGEAFQIGAWRMIESVASVVYVLHAMIQKQVAPELSGIVGIVVMTSERAKIGWDAVLSWTGLISCMLAVLNLLPIPPFDGFRIVLLGLEGVLRRRVDPRLETIVSIAGFIFVIFLFVVLLLKDLLNVLLYGTS